MSKKSPTKLLLLVNLGTPSAPTSGSIRSFLSVFLKDRRVVDLPPYIWYPILYMFVLSFRPRRLVKDYSKIWLRTKSGGMSPLMWYCMRLCNRLQEIFQRVNESDETVLVKLAMRYGDLAIPEILDQVHREVPSIKHVVVLPLFPQYSGSTTACVYDEVFRFYGNPHRRCIPGLTLIRDYADNGPFVEAVGYSILHALKKHFSWTLVDSRPQLDNAFFEDTVIVLSYHSIPVRYADEGDDYPLRCEATTNAIAAYLGKELRADLSSVVVHVYQSRFGKDPWLEPFFSDAMKALPLENNVENRSAKEELAKKLKRPEYLTKAPKTCFVATPSFSVDCLETIHEIGDEGCETFREHGGQDFIFVPCLNDSTSHVDALYDVARPYLV